MILLVVPRLDLLQLDILVVHDHLAQYALIEAKPGVSCLGGAVLVPDVRAPVRIPVPARVRRRCSSAPGSRIVLCA